MQSNTEREYSKLEWIFYIVILPIIFISILATTIFWLLDIEVKDQVLQTVNKIPYIEKLIDDQQFIKKDYLIDNPTKEQLQFTVSELKKTLNEKNNYLADYENKLAKKDEEINRLNQQITELQSKLNEKNVSELSREQEIADLAKVYANMNVKNAANILSALNIEEAVLLLSQMSIDAKSSILEKMSPENAAKLSILLKDQKYSKDKDIQALQSRINSLLKEINNLKNNNSADKSDYQDLLKTLANMEPRNAANVVWSLYLQDEVQVKKILTAMDSQTRAKILNELSPANAADIAVLLVE
ncbi:hypothetical protein BHF71_00400 [Vulcanibacillus modesticaldus]|uniref:Magnesium transporter MgtE intracellular domain-containing protein n=1 Tax=Vulcanibacillus modesticaldus TaxID=337097 RepID=A0A1D2YXH8_9BACI|nr:hypothetical protein [Vulcanibacillus modesticaldus]OEG00404.1 hypothetical protein BHF71_00400 [Vulcanibacillus modesticaldus]